MPDLRCDRCRRHRSQHGGTHDALGNRLEREGWVRGILDWPTSGNWRPDPVIRCPACVRQHGAPNPIGPHLPYKHTNRNAQNT